MSTGCYFCNYKGDDASDTTYLDNMTLHDICVYIVALDMLPFFVQVKQFKDEAIGYMKSNWPNLWEEELRETREKIRGNQ